MKLLTVIFLVVLSSVVIAQQNFEKYSINPQLGVAYDASTKPWTTYGLEVNFIGQRNLYSIFYHFNQEMELFGEKKPEEKVNEFGILIGRYHGDRIFRFEYQFGLDLIWGVNRGELLSTNNSYYKSLTFGNSVSCYEEKNFVAFGLPLNLGVKILPLDWLAIGLDFQTNLNFEEIRFLSLLSLEFGILRNEIKTRPVDW